MRPCVIAKFRKRYQESNHNAPAQTPQGLARTKPLSQPQNLAQFALITAPPVPHRGARQRRLQLRPQRSPKLRPKPNQSPMLAPNAPKARGPNAGLRTVACARPRRNMDHASAASGSARNKRPQPQQEAVSTRAPTGNGLHIDEVRARAKLRAVTMSALTARQGSCYESKTWSAKTN